jgi:uncharacterized membrane protein
MVELAWPYTDDAQVRARYDVMEYPVGISYWAWGTAQVTHLLAGSPDLEPRYSRDPGAMFSEPDIAREVRLYVAVNAVGLGALTLLSAWFLAGVHPRRPWDAAAFALSPALALAGLVNWDLLAVVTVAGALWAWSRGSPALTGVMIGLGTAVKLYPLFLLGAVVVLCLRRRRAPQAVVAVSAAFLTWLLANAPAFLSGPDEWKVFWSFNSERGADLGSVWLLLSQAADVTFEVDTINTVSLWFFVAWCAGVAVLGLVARDTPRLAQLGFLLVAGFLLVNKVYSPQYVLWLLPLAVLARPRWRDLLIWQAGEVFYFACVWWYLGGFLAPGAGGDAGAYWVAIVLRMMAELYLVAVVVRDLLRPAYDPVRTGAADSMEPPRVRVSR